MFQKDGTHCYKVKQKLNLLKYNSFSFNKGMSFQQTMCNRPYELTSFSTLWDWRYPRFLNKNEIFLSILQFHISTYMKYLKKKKHFRSRKDNSIYNTRECSIRFNSHYRKPVFPTSYVVDLLCSMSWDERWLFVLFILVELLTMTV